MDSPPNFDDVLATLRRVALAAGDMILKGSESIRQKQAAGVDRAVKEKLICMLHWQCFEMFSYDWMFC